MLANLGRYWRILGTGLSFSLFGLWGLILRILVFPIINLLFWEKSRRRAISRGVVRLSCILFIWIMFGVGVLRYTVTGLDRLKRKGLLVIANHPTLIDTIFLIAFIKDCNCIVKSSLWKNPFTAGLVYSADYLRNDDPEELLTTSIEALSNGDNLIIFPEGTRTASDGIVRLKRGAANIAIRGQRKITPVIISCSPRTLEKDTKWWQVPPKRAHFQIDVQEDLDVTSFIEQSTNENLAARGLTTYLQDYFNKGTLNHAFT